MSNSEPSAIVLQGIPCMRGLYRCRFEWRKRFGSGPPRVGLNNWTMGIGCIFVQKTRFVARQINCGS